MEGATNRPCQRQRHAKNKETKKPQTVACHGVFNLTLTRHLHYSLRTAGKCRCKAISTQPGTGKWNYGHGRGPVVARPPCRCRRLLPRRRFSDRSSRVFRPTGSLGSSHLIERRNALCCTVQAVQAVQAVRTPCPVLCILHATHTPDFSTCSSRTHMWELCWVVQSWANRSAGAIGSSYLFALYWYL
ncbi:hypothetical protein BDW74DRAFT_142615 [Aspergillus multicolor]|uniref:uncharacterized protein n=1 Tax=Aspergillus multicolor TaxID=41759 RepID=UPI003CCD3F94